MTTYYTLAEIAQHASPSDYWVIMGDDVYAYKDFVHPGGVSKHEPYYGGKLDMTAAFES